MFLRRALDMAERDTEILALKAQIAALEARPTSTDLDWLKNSEVWKRAEFNAQPIWRYMIRAFVAFMFFCVLGIPIMRIIFVRLHQG